MTVPAQSRRSPVYLGNGVTDDFPFTFKVYADTDIAVVKAAPSGLETVLALNVDYTVARNSDQDSAPGGTVTCTTPPASGERLVVIGSLAIAQTTNLTNFGFFPESVEDMGDKITMMVQQLADAIARSLTRAATDPNTTLTLPAPVANKLLGWDSSGAELENKDFLTGVLVTAFMETVLAASNAAAARTLLGTIGALYSVASGGDIVVFTSTATGAEAALRLDATQVTSGMSLKISNSGLNKQGSVRIRNDGGLSAYVNQAAGAASTSGVQALDIGPDGNIVVGQAPAAGAGRSITIFNNDPGAASFSRLQVQSDAGSAFLQVQSVAGGRAVTLYSNTGSSLNLFTQDAQQLRLGTNNNAARMVFGATSGITCNEDMQFATGTRPIAKNTAKAWVTFNGVGTVSIRDSFNVSSITDNGAGDYTVNFANAMANANYAWALSCGEVNTGYGRVIEGPYISAPTVSAFRFSCSDIGGSRNDYTHISALFFGA